MSQKNRQAQIFTGPVDFYGPVSFKGIVTIRSVSSELGVVSSGLVAAAVGGSVVQASSDILAHADRILGVSVGGGQIVTGGEVTGPWSFDIGDNIYLNQFGQLDNNLPIRGFQQQLGIATGTSSVLLSPLLAIILFDQP